MHILIAILIVGALSIVSYVAGMAFATARILPEMVRSGWTPPTPTRSENPWRGSGGAR